MWSYIGFKFSSGLELAKIVRYSITRSGAVRTEKIVKRSAFFVLEGIKMPSNVYGPINCDFSSYIRGPSPMFPSQNFLTLHQFIVFSKLNRSAYRKIPLISLPIYRPTNLVTNHYSSYTPSCYKHATVRLGGF